MSEWLMRVLFWEYVALSGWFAGSKCWYLAIYWGGAAIIQFAVWKGMR